MKKIFSFILALTMAMSVFTFNASAGTEGTLKVTYTDAENLKVGDIFNANVVLTGAEGIFGVSLNLTWDNTIIEPVASDGTVFGDLKDAQKWAKVTSNRIDTTLKAMDEDYYDESTDTFGKEINAFNVASKDVTTSSLLYQVGATQAWSDGVTHDYPLSGDLNVISVRFRVVAAGDAKIALTNELQEMKGDKDVRPADVTVPALVIGSEDVTDKADIKEEKDDNKDKVAEGADYTQGFKTTITANSETINGVDFILTPIVDNVPDTKKALDSRDNEEEIDGWSGLNITGGTPVSFAINVINIDNDKSVDIEWIYTK